MNNLFLHADDFGLSEGVNKAIIALAQNQRLSGTAVMSIFEEAQKNADELKSVKPFDIGLHITLTDQALCRYDTSLVNAAGKAYSKEELIKKAFKGQLNPKDLEKEIKAQISNFADIFGFYPHYYDGHHHVQLLKPVRLALHKVAHSLSIENIYIRSSYMPLSFGFSPKIAALKAMNKDMKNHVKLWDWRSNDFFAGSYGKEGLKVYMKHILSKQKNNLLMMVHPGFVDERLCARDSLQNEREDEYHFLKSNSFSELLNQYHYKLCYVA